MGVQIFPAVRPAAEVGEDLVTVKRRPKKPKGKPESQVTRECLQVLELFKTSVRIERVNCGGFHAGSGRYVAFGRNRADWSGMVAAGPHAGKRFELEIKREGFHPSHARGGERTRFLAQLDRLRLVNASGGIGLWVSGAAQLALALPGILDGARVVFDRYGIPYLETEG
jgi:hypothetical protein